jgi:hypothetical protein
MTTLGILRMKVQMGQLTLWQAVRWRNTLREIHRLPEVER